METTTALLERTAQRMVADLDPVEAVVLFGSRARGTEHAGSDWDVAVLLDRDPDLSIRAAAPTLEYVNVIYKNRKDFGDRALYLGSLESAIVRDGQVLAGRWERPSQRGERIVSNKLVRRHLRTAASGVADAMQQACLALGGDEDALTVVSRHTQVAAEFTSKAAMMHLGIDPKHVHDLVRLADQLEREGPDDHRTVEWAATIRSMNGLSTGRHINVCAEEDFESLERPFDIVSTVTEFFAVVLRDIAETRDSFAPHAAAIAGTIEKQSRNMRGFAGWEHVPDTVQARLDAWKEEVQSIARLAQSRTRRTARGMGDPDESQGMGL